MAKKAARINPGKCPICEDNVVEEFRPFCSKRCATLDLGKWLTGSYVISGSEDSDEDGGLPATEGTFPDAEDDSGTRH